MIENKMLAPNLKVTPHAFNVLVKEIMRQYQEIDPPIREAVDILIVNLKTASPQEIQSISSLLYEALYDHQLRDRLKS